MNNKNKLPTHIQFYLQAGWKTTMQFVVALSETQKNFHAKFSLQLQVHV